MLNKDDEMLNIVTCRECKKPEYYGMMHWLSGHTLCRRCIYELWSKQSDYKWTPSNTDYTFPLYSDGVDYSKKGGKR